MVVCLFVPQNIGSASGLVGVVDQHVVAVAGMGLFKASEYFLCVPFHVGGISFAFFDEVVEPAGLQEVCGLYPSLRVAVTPCIVHGQWHGFRVLVHRQVFDSLVDVFETSGEYCAACVIFW